MAKDKMKGMVSEDMSAPSNLPREVMNKQFGQLPDASFDYDGSEHGMFMQEADDKRKMNSSRAKRRY